MSNIKYRPDIDGLRSLAILPVLFYHAGIPGFSGGFVGVDVFFVISGFLITSILAREFSNHSYSIASFYERRIRRIFPALLVVLIFVLAASPFVLLPSEFSSLGRDAASAIFFVANINFWRQSGYFASDAEAKPLLHMWSLGVEEQFYLIAPLALYLALRFAPRYRLLLVGAAAAGSFVLCVYLTPTKPSAAFYLLPTRAWELLVGSWLALWLADRPSTGSVPASRKQSFAGLFGVALIIFAVFAYSKATSFPGYAALAPVLGSALLIYSGQNTVTGLALSWRPLVGVGLISFSLYLWHWPILVIFRNLGWLNSWTGVLCAITASIAAAWATWRWVETPTRDRRFFPTRRIAISTMAMTLAVLATCAVYATLSGWPSRVSKEVLAFDEARNDRSPERERCHADGGLPDPRRACVLGAGGPTTVAVWGDSHGVELAEALGELGVSVQEITYSSCPPALNLKAKGDRPFCQRHNNQVFDYLVNNASIKTVVLAAYYGYPLSTSADLQLHLADTANALTAAGKRVVIIGPYVSIDGHVDVPTHLARGGDRKVPFGGDGITVLRQRIGPSVQLVSPIDIFCRDGYCDLIRDGLPLYFDAHHPSMHASRVVASGVLPLISVGSNH